MNMVRDGYFSPEERGRFKPLFDALTYQGDYYMLLADYGAYIACQEQAAQLYRDPQAWTRKAILNVAGIGRFSTDRTIREYAETVWDLKPMPRPAGG